MGNRFQLVLKRTVQILVIAALALLFDYLVFSLAHDDSIWLGASIEVVASIIISPVVGFFSTLISDIMIDILAYHSLEYSYAAIFEALAVALIGVIYRRLLCSVSVSSDS